MKLLVIVFTAILFSSINYGQKQNDDVLAKIGDKIITVEEFKYRYEFTPQINRKSADDTKAKEELLYTLIAENLFAIEAESKGFDTLEVVKSSYIPLEKMYVRDALYKTEISDKVEFNKEKFNDGIELAHYKCFVDYVYSKDKYEIDNAYKLLNSDSNFDSLVTLISDAEYVADPYEVTYGKMNQSAEKAIFSLGMNEFTNPIQSPDGWYIFRLISKIPTDFSNIDQKYSKVKKVVEGRIEDSIYNDFWQKFFVGKEVTTDGALFWYFAENVQKTISEIKTTENIKENEKIGIADFGKLKSELHPDSLKKDFIKFTENPITLEEFFNYFSFEGFFTFSTDLNKISAQLNSRVKRQIEHELLSRDGYKRGMESLPEVKNSTEIWKENYLSTILKKDVVVNTDLSEKEIENFLESEDSDSLNEIQVNILEVLTDSLEVIKDALTITDDNKRLSEFASKHTKRISVKNNGGEFGFFNSSEHGEIGKLASSMQVGDVYGPLETNEGYSLFKVIDKKVVKLGMEEVNKNEKIKNRLKYNKIMDSLENMAADLAEEHKVTVNNELLNSLNLLNTQMVVFRYMGFGGKIQAFPYSTPFYKWKEKWEQKKKDLL